MTRRRKNKAPANNNAATGIATPAAKQSAPARISAIVTRISAGPLLANAPTVARIASPKTTVRTTGPNASLTVTPSSNHTVESSSSLRTVKPTSSSQGAATNSNLVVSSSTSETSDKYSKKNKTKKPERNIVKYVTKQIYIQPRHPILTVERLPNLDYYVRALTEILGWRPRVYPHGKGVRFVPESNEEFRIMQRYMAKIESEERIAWCTYTLPPGNSLKVNIKVRVVEPVKIEKDLQKLSLQSDAKPVQMKQTDSSTKNVQLSTSNSRQDNTKLTNPASINTRLSLPYPVQTDRNNNIVQGAVVQARYK